MKIVLNNIIIRLPKEEKFDLVSQMRRACKAAPALLAEGFAKRYQKRQWSKYLDDCVGECNEMIHHLSICRDIYFRYFDQGELDELIKVYEVSCRQLYKLKGTWVDFHGEG